MRLKFVGLSLGVLLVLVVISASASALTLPDVAVTLGGTYPLHSQGSLATAATRFGTVSGVTLEGSGATLSLGATELSALGTFTITLANLKIPGGSSCKTGTEPAGTVVASGEYHVVPLNTTGTAGTLFLVSFLEVTCGTAKVKIRGNLLSSLNAATGELTEFGGVLQGENGKQNISEYLNDGGTKVAAKAEVDAGLEFVQLSVSFAEELKVKVSGSQMNEITNK
jgi:hypothetical protein